MLRRWRHHRSSRALAARFTQTFQPFMLQWCTKCSRESETEWSDGVMRHFSKHAFHNEKLNSLMEHSKYFLSIAAHWSPNKKTQSMTKYKVLLENNCLNWVMLRQTRVFFHFAVMICTTESSYHIFFLQITQIHTVYYNRQAQHDAGLYSQKKTHSHAFSNSNSTY